MNIEVNYLGVFLAAVASMLIGFAWYSQVIFGKQWMQLMGYTPEKLEKARKEMGNMYAVSFVLALVTAYVLFHVMTMSANFFNYPRSQVALSSAFWMWLGFVMPVQMTSEIFGAKNWKLFGINTGYQLVSLLVMAVVLGMV